jgi:hypothetical protein
VYGYGKPQLEKALFSDSQRVLLLRENTIRLNSIHIYYFYLPDEFISVSGTKKLIITLVYDPLVNKNRVDYIGSSMEFHLFQDMEINEVIRTYKPIKIDLSNDEIVPEELRLKN